MIRRLILGAALALGMASPAAAQVHAHAIDGDTIQVGTERIRMVGLDAPELHGQCPREIALARAARDRLAELIAGGVHLQRRGSDRYGRTLAVVRDRAGRDLAQVMIGERLARPYNGRGARQGWCDA